MTQTSIDLDALTRDEQLDLLERLWDRLSRTLDDLPVPEEHARLLDERERELEEDIKAGRPIGEPWEEVRKRFVK